MDRSAIRADNRTTSRAPCAADTVGAPARAWMESQSAVNVFPEQKFHTIVLIAGERHLAAAVLHAKTARRPEERGVERA